MAYFFPAHSQKIDPRKALFYFFFTIKVNTVILSKGAGLSPFPIATLMVTFDDLMCAPHRIEKSFVLVVVLEQQQVNKNFIPHSSDTTLITHSDI